jgi:hypothetical protein
MKKETMIKGISILSIGSDGSDCRRLRKQSSWRVERPDFAGLEENRSGALLLNTARSAIQASFYKKELRAVIWL